MAPDTASQLIPMLTTAPEYERIQRQVADEQLLATIVFSAKEAVYKSLYPILGQRMDFPEVSIQNIDCIEKRFSFTLVPHIASRLPEPPNLVGRFDVVDGLIYSGVFWPR